ncbi:MAG: hypothetical protein WKF97_00890 [Chitinophagaceae bacterium]
MKLLQFAWVAATLFISVTTVKAQSADEIIAKHIEAIGGKEKISQINSLHLESSIEVMGNEATSTTVILHGKGFKNEVDISGQKIIQVITDQGGWSVNPMTGQASATEMTEDMVKAGQHQIYIGGPLFNYAEKGNKVELAGNEDIQGVKAIKLKLTTKGNLELTYFIDPAKYYVIRSISKSTVNGQDVETMVNYSNYQKTEHGYVVPFSAEINLPQGIIIKSTTKKVEINKPVEESIFKAG